MKWSTSRADFHTVRLTDEIQTRAVTNLINITLQSVDSLHKIQIEHRHKHMHHSNPRLHQRTTFRNKMQSADSSEGLSSLGMKCLNNSRSSDASSLLFYSFITILLYKHLFFLFFFFFPVSLFLLGYKVHHAYQAAATFTHLLKKQVCEWCRSISTHHQNI